MNKYFNKIILIISIISLLTSCNNLSELENLGSSNAEVTTVGTSKDTDVTTTLEQDLLIEFNDYTYQKNDDGTFNFTITQDAMEGCYYTISLMYDDKITEFVSGEGYLRSDYGLFAGETSEETSSNEDEEDDNDNDDEDEDITTTLDDKYTLSEDKIKSLIGKDGKWTFKCISEGTQYIEIKLINEFGDIRYKSQYTCIVDTHLEPHLYYTNINY